jgi:predicted transcriptional regulator
VSRAELARLLDLDRSAVTNVFRKDVRRRKLNYEEAEQIVDHLMERLSPLPCETVQSLSTLPKELVKVQLTETVGQVASKLLKGDFTQVPVFDGQNYVGLVTDRMIVERLLHPNKIGFVGKWRECLRKMPLKQAGIIETSAVYPVDASISSVANALKHFYAVMLSENDLPKTIVTRWDYLKLLT